MTSLPSRLGFGVSGAHGTALVPRRATVSLIQDAFERGITVFDTAPAYGAGEAEARLGLALRGLPRDEVFVSTKAGLSSAGISRRIRDFSPDAIEASLIASLKRLGLEGLDALFLHGAGVEELTDALFNRLDALKAAGAFRLLGGAGRGGELDAALDTGRFQALMQPVHPFLDHLGEARLVRAHGEGVEVFAIETAGPGRAPLRVPKSPADLYRLARDIRRPGRDRRRVGVTDGLKAALAREEVGVALMTTTRPAHLAGNAALFL